MANETSEIAYRAYLDESDLPHIMALVQSELSEPYVIYTYRYFLHQWCVNVQSLCRFHLTFILGPIYHFSSVSLQSLFCRTRTHCHNKILRSV